MGFPVFGRIATVFVLIFLSACGGANGGGDPFDGVVIDSNFPPQPEIPDNLLPFKEPEENEPVVIIFPPEPVISPELDELQSMAEGVVTAGRFGAYASPMLSGSVPSGAAFYEGTLVVRRNDEFRGERIGDFVAGTLSLSVPFDEGDAGLIRGGASGFVYFAEGSTILGNPDETRDVFGYIQFTGSLNPTLPENEVPVTASLQSTGQLDLPTAIDDPDPALVSMDAEHDVLFTEGGFVLVSIDAVESDIEMNGIGYRR